MVRWGKRLFTLFAATWLLAGLAMPTRAQSVRPAMQAVRFLPDSGMMCLTFDDGSGTQSITRIMDCLRERRVHSTFFVIGKCLRATPDLWRQAVADGHEIAYHSMYHKPMGNLSKKAILDDVDQWKRLAHEVLGEDYDIPRLARLPYGHGHQSQRVLGIFHSIGYTVVGWNADTFSGVPRDGNYIRNIQQYVLAHAEPGTILLQHFNPADSVALMGFIDALMARVTLGTVSQAMAAQWAHRVLAQGCFMRVDLMVPLLRRGSRSMNQAEDLQYRLFFQGGTYRVPRPLPTAVPLELREMKAPYP